MTEPQVGQVWTGKDGAWRIDVVDDRGKALIVHDAVKWAADDPARVTMVTDREAFLRSHRLETDEAGEPVPPPVPDPRPGDVVRLRCGGPPMVVVETGPAVMGADPAVVGVAVICMWHLDTGALCKTGIPVHCLTTAPGLGPEAWVDQDEIAGRISEALGRK